MNRLSFGVLLMIGFRRLCTFTLSLALMASPAQAHASGTVPKMVKLNGVQYLISQDQNEDGRVIKQIIKGSDSTQILIDTNGDGSVDHFEVVKGTTTVRALNPYYGHFTRIEMQKHLPSGTISAEYMISRDRKTYRLMSKSFEPHKVVNSSVIVGDMCRESDLNIFKFAEQWQKILAKLRSKEQEEAEQSLYCTFRRAQNVIFDQSCLQGDFKESVEDMTKGLMEVMFSKYDGPQGGQFGAPPPTYLQCLQRNRLPTHAARIEAEFMGIYFDAANAIERLPAEVREKFRDPSNCNPVELPSSYRSSRSSKLISCKTDVNRAGSYDGTKKQLVLHQPRETIAKSMQCSSSHGYARTMFHELLHLSEMSEADHDFIGKIESCCAEGEKSQPQSCADMRGEIDERLVNQSYESIFLDRVDGYEKVKTELDRALGADLSNRLLGEYFSSLGASSKEDSAIYMACVAEQGACDEACKNACNDQYVETLHSKTKNFFENRCPSYQPLAKSKSGFNCNSFGRKFADLIRPSYPPLPVGRPDTRAIQVLGEDYIGLGPLSDKFSTESLVVVPPEDNQAANSANDVDPSRTTITDSPVSMSSIPLGETMSVSGRARDDIAAVTNRGTKLVDFAHEAIDKVGNSILPRAQAATERSSRDRRSPASRQKSVQFDSLDGDYQIDLPRSISNPFMQDGFTKADVAAGAKNSRENRPLAGSGSSALGQNHSPRDSEVRGEGRNPASAQKASSSAKSGRGSGVSVGGGGGFSAGSGTAPITRKAGRGTASAESGEALESAQPAAFKNASDMRRYLISEWYSKVKQEFGKSEFRRQLIDFGINIKTSSGERIGSQKPRYRYEHCRSKNRLVLPGACK